jgi:hypothetical protein
VRFLVAIKYSDFMMFGHGRRVGRPARKRLQQYWCCYRKRADRVCGYGRNVSQAVAGGEKGHIMLHVVYDGGDEVAICSDDDAGMILSYEESGVHREMSDVEEEDDNNEDGLEEELEGDLDVQVVEGDVEMLAADDGVADVVELLPQKCRNCNGGKQYLELHPRAFCGHVNSVTTSTIT